jgi:hypothetical protein
VGVSNWLEGARVDDGLFVPADPAKHAVDLLLASSHVELQAGSATGVLRWEDFGRAGDRTVGRNRWSFAPWAAWDVEAEDRWTAGVGIAVHGRCVVDTLEVRAARDTRRNRFNRSMTDKPAVPLAPRSRIDRTLRHDGDRLDGLCVRLARDDVLRARLDDAAWVEGILADLKA